MISISLQAYLVEIYKMKEENIEISCLKIAKKMNIPIKKSIQAAQRLHYQNYIQYTTYQPIQITPRGEQMARYIISKNRLLYNFLDILQITQNIELEKESMQQCFSDSALNQIEQFVLFINQYPEITNYYKLFLNEQSKMSILEKIPPEDI